MIENIQDFLLKKISNFISNLLNFILLQIFITLFLLPILIFWGLPLSIVSPIGNLIFAPFLIVFLLLSNLIFFFQILAIPNQLLIEALEFITFIWLKVLKIGQKTWLIYMVKPSLLLLSLIPIIATILIYYKQSSYFTLAILTCLLIIFLIYLKLFIIPTNLFEIKKFNNKEIYIIKTNKVNILIDTGTLSGKRSDSWTQYKLISYMIKKGIYNIDYLIILKPGIITFKSVYFICNNLQVKNIYIANWNANIDNKGWKAWNDLLNVCKQSQIKIESINTKPIKLILNNSENIFITPENYIRKNNFNYPKISINLNLVKNKTIIQNH